MTDDPYRTPGEVILDEERRARWLREYQNMGLSDTRNWTPEQRAKFEARYADLQRRLTPRPIAVASRVSVVKMFAEGLSRDELAEVITALTLRYNELRTKATP